VPKDTPGRFADKCVADTEASLNAVPWPQPRSIAAMGRWASVAWFRRRKTSGATGGRAASREDVAHLEAFIRSRRGVEGFIEPKTTVTETTLLLVAHDGEWTRRRMPGPDAARQFGNRLAIPVYDVALVGYPRRMREYNARRKQRPEAS
jgi:hypothetical protein